jgi:hypothetical protein
LQRLFVGWNRFRVVKEKVDGQRIYRIVKSGKVDDGEKAFGGFTSACSAKSSSGQT